VKDECRQFIILFVRVPCTAVSCAADVDECTVNNGGCHPHANCSNTPGSFTCACIEGYIGDGFNCSGTLFLEI